LTPKDADVLQGNHKLSPGRRIQLKRAGIRLQQIIARLAALHAEYKRLNPPQLKKSR
jgi:hypothetical protein